MQKQELIDVIFSTKTELNITLIDAIIHISEEYGLEIEAIAQQIKNNQKIKEELKRDGIALNMLK